jgi:hypothetical protein
MRGDDAAGATAALPSANRSAAMTEMTNMWGRDDADVDQG